MNDRNKSDYANLHYLLFSGMLVGTDGCPKKNKWGDYCIAGGEDRYFKATAIEFYGVKTQI